MTLPLTNMYDDSWESAYKMTPPGMAHLAGSGPENRTCRECSRFYHDKGKWEYYAASNRHAPNGLKPGRCGKYRELMKHNGAKFPHNMRACRHFEEAEKAPVAMQVWK